MKIIIANSFSKKLFGLSYMKEANYALLFKKCNKIHTFMMRFNLDLYILDNNNVVVDIKKILKRIKLLL